MKSTRLQFENSAGQRLAAILDQPVTRKPLAYAIFAHCFTCTKNLKAIFHINRALTAAGIAVLRFDFTGLGQSEGDFSHTNFSSNVSDLECAAAYLQQNYQAPELLIGHSLGGAAAIVAASKLDSIKAVATIGSPSEPSHVIQHFNEYREAIEQCGEASVTLEGKKYTIAKQFLDDVEAIQLKQTLQHLKAALLVCHSPGDKTVNIRHAGELFQAAQHPKSFISLDNADHLLSNEADARYVGQLISSWASRFLALDILRQPLSTDEQIVAQTLADSYYTEINADDHMLVADEPKSLGGTDLGPTPYELLSSALAACTSITLQMYARRKNIPLQEVRVHITHKKAHADDCIHCDDSESKIDHFVRRIELFGKLTEQQQHRLLEIAERCPVHRTLHGEVVVITELKG